jgi:S1-C subfamily serine protease
MFAEAIAKIQGSIFPIFFRLQRGREITIGISGTGFFIDDIGHFLTAHHVIINVPKGSELLYAGNVPHRPLKKFDEIREVYKDIERDLFLGKIEKDPLPKIEFANETPRIGTSICLCGYPLARLAFNPKTGIDVKNARQYWQPTYLVDYAEATIDNRNYKGFITQDTSLAGMSGGPVFDKQGRVCGIDVATWRREIVKPGAPTIPVNNGLVTKVEVIKEFIKKADIK